MTIRVYAKHEPYRDGRIGIVGDELALAGQPTIRCVEFNGEYFATEGSHRLYLCFHDGVVPKLTVEDTDAGDDDQFLCDHWDRVKKLLPYYDFEHVEVLDFREVF